MLNTGYGLNDVKRNGSYYTRFIIKIMVAKHSQIAPTSSQYKDTELISTHPLNLRMLNERMMSNKADDRVILSVHFAHPLFLARVQCEQRSSKPGRFLVAWPDSCLVLQ